MTAKNDLDVVFFYPPLSVQERYGNRNIGDVGGHVPPIGIMILAAYVREKGYSADVIDAVINNWGVEEIINYIRTKKPKIVGFSAITPIFHLAVLQLLAIAGYYASSRLAMYHRKRTLHPVQLRGVALLGI